MWFKETSILGLNAYQVSFYLAQYFLSKGIILGKGKIYGTDLVKDEIPQLIAIAKYAENV